MRRVLKCGYKHSSKLDLPHRKKTFQLVCKCKIGNQARCKRVLKAHQNREKMSFKKNLMMKLSLQNLLFSKTIGPREGLFRECQPGRLRRLKAKRKKSGEKRVKRKVVFISLGAKIQTILVPMLSPALMELKV